MRTRRASAQQQKPEQRAPRSEGARRFNTALRAEPLRQLERLGRADVVVGIPCFNNDSTIEHVIASAARGLAWHYPGMRCAILVADGGSTDDTREVAGATEVEPGVEKLVFIYRGLGGKGSAFRAIFEAAQHLEARALVLCDADLRSITPGWIRSLAEPILAGGFDYVAPLYRRYKYDGTITNNIVYNLTRALFGTRIRQPIGGDFGVSAELARFYARQDVWESDVARFGVDIWMTASALAQGYRVCQTHLGTKVHDPKDPSASLGPMFRQVVGTLFALMEQYEPFWRDVRFSQPVPTFGEPTAEEPEAFPVDRDRLIEYFRQGFDHFAPLWEKLISADSYALLAGLVDDPEAEFRFPIALWVKTLYDFAATYHRWPRDRGKLVEIMTPLYYARIAGFINDTASLSEAEAEQLVEVQAEEFEEWKPYLMERWNGQGWKGTGYLR